MSSSVDISNFVKSLNDSTTQIISKVALNMDKVVISIDRKAKQNCPVDQGLLRASMGYKVERTFFKIVGTNYNTSEYAPYVHNGTGLYAKDGNGRKTPWKYKAEGGKYKGWHITRGQKPQPFLQKARDEEIKNIARKLAE